MRAGDAWPTPAWPDQHHRVSALHRARWPAICWAVYLTGCAATSDDPPTRAEADAPPPVTLRLDTPHDTAATLAQLEQFVAAVDGDTVRMQRVSQPLDIGAGALGTLTAWRAGGSWQRLRVDAEGADFRTADTYWLHDGTCVGARLESVRADERPTVERLWFRDSTLYRWTDAAGRRLERDARSTQSEVGMLRARLDRAMQQLRESVAPGTDG